jgi:hypothetical protein
MSGMTAEFCAVRILRRSTAPAPCWLKARPLRRRFVLMRDGVESLRARIGYAASLRVRECADGVPRFATYVPYPSAAFNTKGLPND